MKKSKSITKYIDKKNAGIELVKELKKMENVEDLGTSIYQTSMQFYLIIQSLLKERFNFDEKDLKELNKEVTKAVEGLAFFEDKGLNPLSVYSVGQLTDITLNHYQTLKAGRAGLELPTSSIAKKMFLKQKK